MSSMAPSGFHFSSQQNCIPISGAAACFVKEKKMFTWERRIGICLRQMCCFSVKAGKG